MEKSEMTLRYFFGNVWNALTFTDVKLLRSVCALLFKPGKLTAVFFEGKRKLYTAPLTLFFFINLVYFLYQPVDALNSNLRSQTMGQFYSEWANDVVNRHLEENEISREDFFVQYNQMTGQVSKLCLIVFVLLFAGGIALVNVRRGELFYFHLISATHFVSFSILSMLILVPLILTFGIWGYLIYTHQDSMDLNENNLPITMAVLVVLGTYAYGMQKRLYGQRWYKTLINSVFIIIAFMAAVLAYRFFLFTVTMQLV